MSFLIDQCYNDGSALFFTEPNTWTEHRRTYQLPLSVFVLPESFDDQQFNTVALKYRWKLHRVNDGVYFSKRVAFEYRFRSVPEAFGLKKLYRFVPLLEKVRSAGFGNRKVLLFSPELDQHKPPNRTEKIDLSSVSPNKFVLSFKIPGQVLYSTELELSSKKRNGDLKRKRENQDDGEEREQSRPRYNAPVANIQPPLPCESSSEEDSSRYLVPDSAVDLEDRESLYGAGGDFFSPNGADWPPSTYQPDDWSLFAPLFPLPPDE